MFVVVAATVEVQANRTVAPGSRVKVPAVVVQSGAARSAIVRPGRGTEPVFVTVRRQIALPPAGTTVDGPHGPGPSAVQSAGSADWHTCLSTVAP
jgi:hypothetical protein